MMKWIKYILNKIFGGDNGTQPGDPKLRLHKPLTEETADGIKKTLSAQPPTVTVGNIGLSWRHIGQEKPRYYDPIHIWDGQSLNMDWCRVWSEELEQDIYVNLRDDRVISKITHWSPPHGITYPKYEPMTGDDIKEYSKNDMDDIVHEIQTLIDGSPLQRLTNEALAEAITIIRTHTNIRHTKGN